MNHRSLRRMGVALVAVSALGSAGWIMFGSAATLPVTPKNASAFRTCVLTAYPSTSAAGFDAWVDENTKAANNGGKTTIQVQSRSSRNRRAFLRFELTKCVPVVASSATVESAKLRLSLATAPSANRTYDIKRVTGPCPEAATTCWTQNGLTWNNQPTVAAGASSTLALTSSSATNQYYVFDVTADIAAMVADTASNYGWRIADTTEGASSAVLAAFHAKNASNAATAPQLVIAYSP